MKPGFPPIHRLSLRQYKSIEQCDFELSPLTLLVGRNGVGKSNLLDALAFVTDALLNNLEYAIRRRGGISQVRRKSPSKPTFPSIVMNISLPNGHLAKYGFEIATVKGPVFRVNRELCVVTDASGRKLHEFSNANGAVQAWTPNSPKPPIATDRLYLVAAAGLPEFRPVYDVLTRMVFHNLNPDEMKRPQQPQPGSLLARDGSNLASVLKQLKTSAPDKLDRVIDYIRAVGVPIRSIEHKQAGSLETFEVVQERFADGRVVPFEAISLSDGTIRALGILVSLVSVGPEGMSGPSLIGIEEPETALHPAAAGALMDALTEGSETAQILVTCHSPDLLEHSEVRPQMIRAVVLDDGSTRVGPLAPSKTALLQEHLTTAGELLRLDQLEPDPEDLQHQKDREGSLWEAQA